MQSWEAIIRRVPLFAGLTEEDFQELIPLAKVKGCHADTYLFERGEYSDAFYVIGSGRVRIDIPADKGGSPRNVVLGAGDFFGEMGVLRCTERAADAYVLENSTILAFAKDDFDELMAVNAGLAERVMAVFMSRLQELERPPGDLSVQPPERRCRVFTLFSPSGGAGTSLLAANLAVKAREFTQKRILLVDADFEAASLHVMLSATPAAATIAREVNIEGADIPKYVQSLHYGIDLMPGPAAVEDATAFSPAICRSMIANAADLYDYIFIDTPSSLHEPNLTIFQESEQIFMLLTPDLVSVSRVHSALSAFARAGMEKGRIKLVLNKFVEDSGLSVNDLEDRFERRILGRIQFDPKAALQSANDGIPLVKSKPRSTICVDICRTVRQLLALPSAGSDGERVERSFSLFGLLG